jgi:predicted nucleic acid-binding protein
MTATTSLRVRVETRDALNGLARAQNMSMADFLDFMVAREREAQLLAAMNQDFGALRADTAAWRQFKTETDAWDATSVEP